MSTIEDNVNTVKSETQVPAVTLEAQQERLQSKALDPKRCSVIRPTGEQCRAPATRKTGKCAGHSGLGVAANPQAYAEEGNRKSAAVRSERAAKAKRTAAQVHREAVEEHSEELVAILLEAARDKEAGWGDRMRAVQQLVDRALGKPKETIEDARQGTDTEALGLADLEAKRRELESAVYVSYATSVAPDKRGMSRH